MSDGIREGAAFTLSEVEGNPRPPEPQSGALPAEVRSPLRGEFLLAREPKESILSQFDLPVIARYFPEYEREIKKHLGT